MKVLLHLRTTAPIQPPKHLGSRSSPPNMPSNEAFEIGDRSILGAPAHPFTSKFLMQQNLINRLR